MTPPDPQRAGAGTRPPPRGSLKASAMLDRVLTVCSGNICRSPMAEGLLRARLGPARRVASAGLQAVVGRPADPEAVALLRERGIDISSHVARQLTPELLAEFDLVLVMEDAQRVELERLARSARGRVHRIGKFGGFEVEDPHRRGRPAFERALALIERGVDDFDRAFWRTP